MAVQLQHMLHAQRESQAKIKELVSLVNTRVANCFPRCACLVVFKLKQVSVMHPYLRITIYVQKLICESFSLLC